VKASELRAQSIEELEAQQSTLQRELWKARMGNYTNQLDDTAKIRRLRREIARVKTVITERTRAPKQD
jgi:large subunit ribosomal protein L29